MERQPKRRTGREMERDSVRKTERQTVSYRVVAVFEAHVLNHNYRRGDRPAGRKTK